MPYGGLGDAQDDWTNAIANLHNLALTIGEARKAGQLDAANALIPQYNYWLGQAKNAAQELYGSEMPSSVMLSLSQFSDFATGAVSTAVTALSGILPLALGVGVVLFLMGKGKK